MAKLQPCPKCGAQFDVSAFAAGTKFTCGACGAVVTAGAPAAGSPVVARVPGTSRTPPAPAAPSRPVPAPSRAQAGGGGGGSSPRGPQYVPLERRAQAPEPATRTGRRREADEETAPRARGERAPRSERKKNPLALLAVTGGLLVVIVAGLLFLNSGDKDKDGDGKKPTPAGTNGGGTTPVAVSPGATGPGTSPGTTGPAVTSPGMAGGTAPAPGTGPAGATALPALEAEYAALGSGASKGQMRDVMLRAKALGVAAEPFAKRVAGDLIRLGDPNDRDARALLGHREFTHGVPDEVDFRKYPFVRAVEEAHEKRWFEDEEGYALAMKAYERTLEHVEKLKTDNTYVALETARKAIDRDEYFKGYNYDAIFASPYLICYSSEERINEEDFIGLPPAERRRKLDELDKKKLKYHRILAEKREIYTQLYKEFLKRYEKECDLRDLIKPYGGRPDYPITKRSFPDGCPLIVWIFSDKKAFEEYHSKIKKDDIDPNVAGYFSPATGWVYLYDEDGSDREFEVNKNVHEGTHQLQHWFTRQKNEWGPAFVPQSFFGEGFAEYTGSVTMAPDRTLTFVGVNRPRLRSAMNFAALIKKDVKKDFGSGPGAIGIFPCKDFVRFEGYHTVAAWAQERWGISQGVGLFYCQAWAFVYFLNEYQGGKYRAPFLKFVNDMLNHPRTSEGYGFEKFKQQFKLVNDAKWKALQDEFEPFYKELLKMDLAKVGPTPPDREVWPGYVPPESLDAGKK
jgi:hypothetical protein